MKILFLAAEEEDYLSDGLLIGLRGLLGENCVDYPKAERLYKSYRTDEDYPLYGRGFTLYSGLFDDVIVDRNKIVAKIKKDYFDLVIIANIWNQYGIFSQLLPILKPSKTIILDGADSPQVYPFTGVWWSRPSHWLAPRAHKKFLYYKREWTPDSQFNLWHRLVPSSLRKWLPQAANLRQISFSIPTEKIVKEVPNKLKDFATHCVDPEVASCIRDCRTSYAFENEAEYYADLRASRFAITTKRAGWDCLRHYEIAANGCVMCFKGLENKPDSCAPYGLKPGVNCLSYINYHDLVKQISEMSIKYDELAQNSLRWAHGHSSISIAEFFLSNTHRI